MIIAWTIALAFASTFALARVATRWGWVDAGTDAPLRKLQSAPVPPVGGAAIALALCVAGLVEPSALASFASGWTSAALAAGFAVGLADDLAPGGLSPAQKVGGQIIAGALFAVPAWSDGAWSAALALLAAVAAQNALNTFDNADGAATALAMCGLVVSTPVAAAAALGFLPFNLWIGARDAASRRFTPRAYLGDSGSHLLGLALLASPLGWTALCLPLLDLARVSAARIARGIPPWVGDRRHLAHRLQSAGLERTAVVVALLAIAAPPIAAGAAGGDVRAVAACSALTAAAFFAAVRATPSAG